MFSQQDLFLNQGVMHLAVLVVTANNYQGCGVICMFSSCAVKTSLILVLAGSWHRFPPPHPVWKHNLLATAVGVPLICVCCLQMQLLSPWKLKPTTISQQHLRMSWALGKAPSSRYAVLTYAITSFDLRCCLFNFLWPCCVHVGHLSHPQTTIIVDYLSTNMLGRCWSR